MKLVFQSVDDLSIVVLRPELKDRFFNVIRDVLSCAPTPKRIHHTSLYIVCCEMLFMQ